MEGEGRRDGKMRQGRGRGGGGGGGGREGWRTHPIKGVTHLRESLIALERYIIALITTGS